MKKLIQSALALLLVLSMLPTSVLAAVQYTEGTTDYYKVVSQKDWELAPGISEAEIVLNNADGDRRQVMHVVEVDVHNEYTKVIPSIKGMVPQAGNYGVQIMSQQAVYAEANNYGNVVAAMNISLSWYDSTYYDEHPELVGEPLGYMILDGQQYTNSQGQSVGAQTCLVINFDEKDGEARPADMPKTEIRSTSSAITGWEEQVIPANFSFLVKDGQMVHANEEHTSEGASRSMLGIKEDGSIIMVMNDGRQAPYSTGFNNYEMSEAMLKLGCVYAINGDGGGSSQFLSQRPGEELELHCSPSDGAPRATTHGVLVISTAPSTGEFVRASVEADNKYYTPGSKVQFKAVGADLAGGAADIPEEASWQLSDASMGTIDENGLFTSNGTVGSVDAQLVYEGEVKGSANIQIVIPDSISFENRAYTVPFEESIDFNIVAKYGVFDVVLKDSDITITAENTDLGTISGTTYTSKQVADTTNITVALVQNTDVTDTVTLTVGKGSEVAFTFETGTAGADLDNWLIKDHEGRYTTYAELAIVNAENGMVHNGNSALAVHMAMKDRVNGNEGYDANSISWAGDPIVLENATAIGMWVYVPEEATQTEIALNYVWYKDDGTAQRTTPDLCLNDTFNNIETSGWHYLSVPISKSLAYIKDEPALVSSQGYKRNFFLKFYVTNSGNAGDESSYFGDITYYIDDITIDYSSVVDDRIAPVISATYAKEVSTENDIALTYGSKTELNGANFNFTADVSDNNGINASTASVYVDGKAVAASYRNGRIISDDVSLGAGVHRVVYEIADTMGNVQKAVRYIKVAGNEPAIKVVPQKPNATVALTGSVYKVDVVAAAAENVKEVTLKLDLDTMHAWELEHMDLAKGFEVAYSYASVADQKDNAVTIVLTNKNSTATGETVLASLPIRVWSFVNDGAASGMSAADAWNAGTIPAVSVNVEVEQGEVVYKNQTTDIFSADKIHIDTEAYIHKYKMPVEYYQANTYHIHTEEALEDKAATCTEDGYSGRTYCAVCESVVEWGTKETSEGHSYKIIDGKLKCEGCGALFTGIYEGKEYVDGVVAADGWVDDKYYYVNGAKVTGHYVIDGVMHTFDSDGVYDADYAYTDFYNTADGKLMYFVGNKPVTGYQYLVGDPYFFDNNGYGFEGEYTLCGETCTFDDGQFVSCSTANVLHAGLAGPTAEYVIYADGTFMLGGSGATYSFTNHGMRPFIGYNYKIKTLVVGADITRIGGYFFSYSSINNIRFEENSSLQQIGTAAFYEDTWGLSSIELPDSVTYISHLAFGKCTSLTKLVVPASVTSINKTTFRNTPSVTLYVDDGSYALQFAKDNNISYHVTTPIVPDEPTLPEAKGKIVNENGTLYYHLGGARNYAGLIYQNGALYYVRSNGQLAVNRTYWVTKTNDLVKAGNYTFDAEGKMINPPIDLPTPEEPSLPDAPALTEAKGKIVNENGTLYYYLGGARNYAGLIYQNGALYYVRSNGQVASNTTYWVTKTNNIVKAGNYSFDADGKMTNPPFKVPETSGESIPEAEGKIVKENGVYYYYVGANRVYAGLIYQKGHYYYVRSNGQLAVNTTYWTTKTNDLMKAGNYTFDATGKMITE